MPPLFQFDLIAVTSIAAYLLMAAITLAGAKEASRAALRTGPAHPAQGLLVFLVAFALAIAAITACVLVVRANLARARH